MSKICDIPAEIRIAVSGLLKPYGIDISDLSADCSISPKYMTAKQASIYCGLQPKTIRDKALAGEIQSIRIGDHERSRVLILKSDLDNWLERFSTSNKKHA